MPIVKCPKCRKRYDPGVDEELDALEDVASMKVVCPACGQWLRLPEMEAIPAPKVPREILKEMMSQSRLVDDNGDDGRRRARPEREEDEDRPRKRREDDDDVEPRPRKRRRDDKDERPRKRKKAKSRLGLWIGLGVGGLVLIGGIVLLIVLLAGKGAAQAAFSGKWERVDPPKGAGEAGKYLEFSKDGVFRVGGPDFMMPFGPYTLSGKQAMMKTSETTKLGLGGERVMSMRATLTGDDELTLTFLTFTEKYRRMK